MANADSTKPVVSKIDHAVERIAQAILGQEYKTGTFLPSEGELGKQYGVSRSVVRETICRLTAAGLVETRHGVGTYINPATEWNLFDPLLLRAFVDSGNLPAISQELVELRTVVEVESAWRAAQRVSPKQLHTLQQWLEQMEVGIDNLELFARADVAYHNTIIAATDNRFLIQIMQYLTDPIIETRRITTEIGGPAGRREAQHWHREIYRAISARDAEAAADAMRHHMEQLDDVIRRAFLLLTASDVSGGRLPGADGSTRGTAR